ncbi:DUF937 domain-containing protein [Hyphococcus flavus]|uniref:DUF937 domain-containing protein n=1 Tax=Hyphococcus flavus TaxID=1866326 RepID=A0AAE9ZDW5_9PROT|nr:DUF937 domain-containing protein [Hyphococcus flavus]WDI30722.1 DUF937 domain-containing protein [Hyphococcus flavus]
MSLMDQLTQVVVSQISQQASQKTGMEQGLTEKMMPMAMAAIMAGLKKNASQPQGAQALSDALQRHDGSLLNNVDQVSSDNVLADGQKILGHILGGKQSQTERALAKTAGVDQGQIGQLLAMAAPAVLASLGRAKREQGLDASALAGLVTEESVRAHAAAPNELGGLLGFLDQDGDGDFKDDLMEQAGKQLLGGLFGRK